MIMITRKADVAKFNFELYPLRIISILRIIEIIFTKYYLIINLIINRKI